MSEAGRYMFVASMDVTPEADAVFNEVYAEHVAFLMEVPGVRKVTRAKGEAFRLSMAGVATDKPAPSPAYSAMYEIDGPEVLTSPEWAAAIEKGRWAKEVRPHTSNRTHALYRIL